MIKWPIFICYRQADGKTTAERVYELLHDQPIASTEHSNPSGEFPLLDVYFDQTAPSVSDWTTLHEPFLKRARAFIIICSPGVKSKLGENDWVYREIDWWLKNREAAPILVDPLGEDDRWIPDAIANRWPNAQCIPVIESEWNRLKDIELGTLKNRTRNRLLGGIVPSGESIYRKELEQEKQRVAQLKKTTIKLRVALGARWRCSSCLPL